MKVTDGYFEIIPEDLSTLTKPVRGYKITLDKDTGMWVKVDSTGNVSSVDFTPWVFLKDTDLAPATTGSPTPGEVTLYNINQKALGNAYARPGQKIYYTGTDTSTDTTTYIYEVDGDTIAQQIEGPGGASTPAPPTATDNYTQWAAATTYTTPSVTRTIGGVTEYLASTDIAGTTITSNATFDAAEAAKFKRIGQSETAQAFPANTYIYKGFQFRSSGTLYEANSSFQAGATLVNANWYNYPQTGWTAWVANTAYGAPANRFRTYANGVTVYFQIPVGGNPGTTNNGFDQPEAAKWSFVGQDTTPTVYQASSTVFKGYRMMVNGVEYISNTTHVTNATWDTAEQALWTAVGFSSGIANRYYGTVADGGTVTYGSFQFMCSSGAPNSEIKFRSASGTIGWRGCLLHALNAASSSAIRSGTCDTTTWVSIEPTWAYAAQGNFHVAQLSDTTNNREYTIQMHTGSGNYILIIEEKPRGIIAPIGQQLLTPRNITGDITGTAYDTYRLPFRYNLPVGKIINTVTVNGTQLTAWKDFNPMNGDVWLTGAGTDIAVVVTTQDAQGNAVPVLIHTQNENRVLVAANNTSATNFAIPQAKLKAADELVVFTSNSGTSNQPIQKSSIPIRFLAKTGTAETSYSFPDNGPWLGVDINWTLTSGNNVSLRSGSTVQRFILGFELWQTGPLGGFTPPALVPKPVTVTAVNSAGGAAVNVNNAASISVDASYSQFTSISVQQDYIMTGVTATNATVNGFNTAGGVNYTPSGAGNIVFTCTFASVNKLRPKLDIKDAGVATTFGTLAFDMAPGGNRSFRVRSDTGANVDLSFQHLWGDGGTQGITNMTATTAMQYLNSNWNFTNAGSWIFLLINDKTNGRWYRVTAMVGSAYVGNTYSFEEV